MASTIKIKNSTTTGSAPSSLAQGEFAINVADGNLFYGDGSSVKQNFVFDELEVKGNLTAQQYIVSSSVTYMTTSFSSGSTVFGDSTDDTHQFTGSVDITGSITATNLSGTNTGDQDLSSYALIANISGAFAADSASFSTRITANEAVTSKTLVSSSAQISFDSITDVPSGLLSSSADFATAAQGALADTAIQPSDTGSFLTTVAFADITGKPALISSSAQVDHDATTNFSADEHFTQANITTVGTVTTGDVSSILPTGTVSGSSQIDLGLASGTIDISDQTNLVGGTNITLSDDTLNLDADISLTSITASGDISASGDIIANNAVITTQLTAAGIAYPTADGDNGDVLITDGAGNLSFARTTVYANVKNVHGSELVKGMPVHVTGAAGNTSEVVAASASNAATMPAHFILNETLADDAEGLAIAVGYINHVNTGDFSEGDTVYVGADGGYTNVKPTGSNLIQNLGIVDKVDASNGSGFILGAGRSNDVPNISPGYAWVGNSDSVATAVATSSFIPAGTISSSAQITITESQISDLTHYTDSDVKSKLNTEAVVSGSATQVRTFLNVEDGADVTDTANVTAAGALMDSEVTNLAQVKSFDSSDYATAAQGILADTAIQPSDTGSFLTTVAFADVTGKPTLISSSAQVDHDATTNFSADEHFTQANITTVGTVTSGDVSAILPSGTVSGSAQIDIDSTTGTITSAKISDVDAFSQSGTYASLRAQGTTAGDVGLGNVTNESKATMFTSPTFTGTTAAPTPSTSDDSTKIATTAYVQSNLDNLIGNAGAALDTLGELSASLADATGSIESLVTEIDGKLAKSSNLSDLTNIATARTNLGVDPAGTDNSTDVTLAGSYDYITISGQQITRNQIDASTDISNLTTTNVSEGTNEYYTDAKVKTKLNTENVISGSASDVRTFLNVEDGADVTDTANVTAAGALMDSEITNLAQVKSFDSSDYATAAQGALADTAIQPADTGSFSTATGVEDNADVTDTANVTAAGALMDSEVTSLSLIKGLTAAQISGAFDAASASLASDIPTNNNQLTNGAGYTTNTGTVTNVTVGTGLDVTSGTTTPNITLDLTEITVGTGLDTTATGISLDLTEVGFTGGVNNKLITNDGDGTVTAESNLGFDGTTLDVDGKLDIDYSTSNTNTAVVDISNNTSAIMSTDHYTLKVAGGQANGAPSGQQKSYGGYFTAGNTNGALPDSIALYAQGHEDGAPNSYAAVFSGSTGGVVGINTLEPTVELDVVGDINASGTITAAEYVGLPSGLVSSSAQIDHDSTTNFSADEHFTQANITTVGTVTSGDVSAILPSGTISSSAQVDHDSTTNFSADEHFTQANITTVGTVTSGDVSAILPSGLVSGSATVTTEYNATGLSSAGEYQVGARLALNTYGTNPAATAGTIVSFGTAGVSTVGAQSSAAAAKGRITVVTDAADGDELILEGVVKMSTNTGWSTAKLGTAVYMSATAGQVTTTAPSTSGDYVRIVGHVVSATNAVIYFNPENGWIEIT